MSQCAACGAELRCAMVDGGDGACWCMGYAPVIPVPDAASTATCLCPACLQLRIDARLAAQDAGDEDVAAPR